MAATCSSVENKGKSAGCDKKNAPRKTSNEDTLHHGTGCFICSRSAYSYAIDNAIPYKSAIFKRNCKLPQLPICSSTGIDTRASRYPWL